MSQEGIKQVLGWKETDKPNNYLMPDTYTDSAAQQEISQLYKDRFTNGPLTW
ncbi:hypothetical protein [Natronorubrum halophilum]|uniref:hypothetical protein n=1 Tax=Natronorubrum halophilum TaxID=1702106 RepID=UPI0014852AB2|nr:hypothetical protein [Natronorubrum halophilum]